MRSSNLPEVPPPIEILHFTRDTGDEVLSTMERLAEGHSGWINFRPEVPEDQEVRREGAFGFLSGIGPVVPLCTWFAGEARRKGFEPPAVGIQHGTGPRAIVRLVAMGAKVPTGWLISQDHPRRGLVLRLPADEPADRVLEWLLRAGDVLCPIPMTGRWTAEVFGPANQAARDQPG
ncbi:MAG: hypothetical protein ACYDAD_14545 [Acidimicrobiales bacterium]